MRMVSPFSGSVIEGTAERGARSETEGARWRPGCACICGGEDERTPVVEVGIGVGYFWIACSRSEGEDRACLFDGLGRPGEDENGSKAGNNVGAGRFTPDVGDRFG
jgi:hypothetical protein